MTFRLGLTGSIGMGKSTTAGIFAAEGIPVWDADAAVHRLYEPGQPAARAIARLFPAVIDPQGRVSRSALRNVIHADPAALDRVNAVVHPLVRQDRATFLNAHGESAIVVMDIPLLYEAGLSGDFDAIAVVSCPPDIQRERVLARGMSDADLALILSRQMPDAEKRARADYIIPTTSLEVARAAVKNVLADVQRRIDRDA